ncbi:cobalamin-binding protein, partial [Burkholderia pseudomallei]
IEALKPYLIVVWRHGNAEHVTERLRALGIHLYFSEPRHLDDVAASLVKLGLLLGTPEIASAAADAYRRRRAPLRARDAD